jgi:zinc transporter 2
MRDALNVLMEGKPSSIDFSAVIASLHDIDGVRRVHDLRIWSLTMDKVALSVHLAIDPTVQNKDAVLKMASDMLRCRFGVVETTVQIELLTDRHSNCAQCPTPP